MGTACSGRRGFFDFGPCGECDMCKSMQGDEDNSHRGDCDKGCKDCDFFNGGPCTDPFTSGNIV